MAKKKKELLMNCEYLVAGGAGYAGSYLTRQLLDLGHHVRVFDIIEPVFSDPKLEVIVGDILDPEAVKVACQGIRVVFHMIAQLPLANDNELVWSVNKEGTRTLLNAALDEGVGKVVYASTSAVFGVPKTNPITDQCVPAPQEDYGASKLAGEDICAEFHVKGLDITIVRPVTILGADRLGIFQILFEWIYTNRNVPVFGRGHNIYQFLHVSDFCSACLVSAEKSGWAIYNLGAENVCSMREMLERLIDYAGSTSRVCSIPAGLANIGFQTVSALGLSPLGAYHGLMYGRDCYVDVERAKKELNWSATYGHVDMITESYEFYCENRSRILEEDGDKSAHRSPISKQGVLNIIPYFLF